MERIIDFDHSPLHNRVYVNPNKSALMNSEIVFQGTGNVLFVEDGTKIDKSRIFFQSSNCVVYLSRSSDILYLSLAVGQNSTVFIGRNCYFNGSINILATEWQNIILGCGSAFSFGIWIRTADAHLIYDIKSGKRINHSRSILIGDHVWVGQDSLILKGTQIGSGSIIGGDSTISGKRIPSNTLFAGSPAKLIRNGVLWTGPCTHTWSPQDTETWSEVSEIQANSWIYQKSSTNLDLPEIDRILQQQVDAGDRLSVIKKFLVGNQGKDRFYVDGSD